MTVKKLSDTVCIVGLAPSNRDHLMEEPPGVEMWSLNQGHVQFPTELMGRMTRWFQVHPYEEMAARQRPEFQHLEWLREAKIVVYLEEVHPDIPMSVKYPYGAVCNDLGGVYLTSAVAFMLALAIHEKFSLIKLYGVEMASGTEYQDQRPCVEYLIGRAIERGIKVWLPQDCPLLKGPMYAKTVMVSSSHIEKRRQELIVTVSHRRDEYREVVGAIKAIQSMPDSPLVRDKLAELAAKEKDLLAEFNSIVGCVRMCEEFLSTALKGSDPESADLVHAKNGMVQMRGGEDRLYSRTLESDGEALNDTRWWPENSPPVDISERAEAVITNHNNRILAAKGD